MQGWERGRVPENLMYVQSQQVLFANASRLKEHDDGPCDVKPAVPDGGSSGDLPIHLSSFLK